MGIFARIFGICRTKPPADNGCWRFTSDNLEIDLSRARELEPKGGAIRLEDGGLPLRVFVMHGDDGEFHAYHNKCSHAGRRLDPSADNSHVECCSVGKSTWDYQGKNVSGPGKQSLTSFPVHKEGEKLTVRIAKDHCCPN